MKALERIKEIETNRQTKEHKLDFQPDVKFLLKAFQVMREIAHAIMDNLVEGYNLKFEDVDEEFEERMSK